MNVETYDADLDSDIGQDDESVASSEESESDKAEAESDDEEEKQVRRRNEWTVEDDEELKKRVRLHGEGKWKVIFDNSTILQKRYETAPSGTFQLSVYEPSLFDYSLMVELCSLSISVTI